MGVRGTFIFEPWAAHGLKIRENPAAHDTRRRRLIEIETASLSGKTLFISGASRGIGLAIALRAARDGANIVVAAKTDAPHPRLPGTIHTAATAIEETGGKALPLAVDIRFEDQVYHAVEQAVGRFGGIDILVNNASAISLTGTLDTPMKRYDLMMGVNVRGTFLCSQACLPYLERAANPHILTLSPPLDLRPKWFAPHLAYTMAKYGMSMCVLGMAEEFREAGIAVNALWPRTIIATAALQVIPGAEPECGRTPDMVADAAWHILTRDSRTTTGNFFIDDEVLASAGITDLTAYAVAKGKPLKTDLFLEGIP
jgi:citronellol/citronellal dehydrogenase